MRLFEGGIYSKITEEEYQKLRQRQAGSTDNKMVSEGANEVEENESRLKAMSMKTLQGAFYILIIGHITSGENNKDRQLTNAYFKNSLTLVGKHFVVLVFLIEIHNDMKQRRVRKKLISKWNFIPKIANWISYVISSSNQKTYFHTNQP